MDQALDVLDPGEHLQGLGVFGYLTTRDASAFRTASKRTQSAVRAFVWTDLRTRIAGSVRSWRACFPKATQANLSRRTDVRHHEFVHLVGVTSLDFSYNECYSLCNHTFRFLSELRVLNLSNSWQDRSVWAFFRDAFNDGLFQHLGKLEILHLDGFLLNKVTGAFAAHLPRLRTLSLHHWTQGPQHVGPFFKNLSKVAIYASECPWIYQNWDAIPPGANLFCRLHIATLL